MPVSIPCQDLPHWDQITQLDGTDYRLSFRYNQREKRYSLSLFTPDDEPIAEGAKLVVGWPLFLYSVNPLLPPGQLIVVNSSLDTTDPDMGELGIGKRCELMYFTAEEVASAKATFSP